MDTYHRTLVKEWDPYRHLATSHPIDNIHQDRGSDWFDFTSFQELVERAAAFMLAQREQQKRLGGSHSTDQMRNTATRPLSDVGSRPGSEIRRRAAPDGLGK